MLEKCPKCSFLKENDFFTLKLIKNTMILEKEK